jgi:dUTPase
MRDHDEAVTIQPGDIICILTHEELCLTNHIAASAFAMNHWSSQGLLVLNPGHIDPGYTGPLSVRLINIRSTPKNISFGEPIFTVVFEKLPADVGMPYSDNKSREDLERNYGDLDVEQNPGSLGKTIARGESPPFLSTDQVHQAIKEHWLSQCIFWFTLIAAATGLVTVVIEIAKSWRQP